MVDKVTFTGVDNKTDIHELQKIAKEYPFVEFGVLISQNNTGKNTVNRFPDPLVIQNMIAAGIPCSMHVCGGMARHAVNTGNFGQIEDFLKEIGCCEFNLDRMQLNIRGFDQYHEFTYKGETPIIIQVSDEKSAEYYNNMHTKSEKVQALFDVSGGRGISGLEGGFDLGFAAPGYVGFAGGLNPKNIAFAIGYIAAGRMEYPVKQQVWIDMESGVRTDDWFDTKKVLAVCKIVAALI